MTAESATLSITCSIGGVSVPVSGCDVIGGSFGSIGSATVTSSLRMMRIQKIDIFEIGGSTSQVPVYITVGSDSQTSNIFGGEFVHSEWDFASDTLTVHMRDWAGVLVDQKRVLTRDVAPITQALQPLAPGQNLSAAGVSTMNRLVSQIVTDIAGEFGFTPVVNMQSGTDVKAGAIYGSADHVFMTIPQSLWSVLNTLARDTGNEVYVTPDKKLVFGPPGAGLDRLKFSWNEPKVDQIIPVSNLQVTHQPRRNSTFRVLIISYDPAKATTTIGRATMVDANLAAKRATAGLHVGTDAVSVDSALAKGDTSGGSGLGSDRSLTHIQLYTFHWDGLTTDAANARAAAIATDIAKRLLLANFTIDGFPELRPTQSLTITGSDLPDPVSGNVWYVSGYRHSWRLPGGRSGSGFQTHISALDIPSVGLATGR